MTQTADIILYSKWLVLDGQQAIQDAGLAVADGVVLLAGPRHEVAAACVSEQALELGEACVFPGFVNGHTHAAMTWFRGLADDLPLMDWLQRHIFPAEQRHTPETVRLGAQLACAEMLAAGITCFADMHFWSDAVAEAVKASGMRALLGEALFGFPTPASPQARVALERAQRLRDSLRGHPRLRLCVAPHSVYTTSPSLLAHAYSLAELWDCPYSIHAAESADETRQSQEKHQQRPLAHLDALGVLSPRTMLIHGVDLSPEEIDLVANRGCAVIHNPRSNMKLASGLAPVPALLEAGVRLGLGTDGPASNNQLNMFTEMHACALLHKGARRDAAIMPAATVFSLATRGAAAALGWPELGTLHAGAPADCCVVDMTRPHLLPCPDPVAHAVYSMHGGEAIMTMVAGEILYRDGQCVRFNQEDLFAEIESRKAFALAASGGKRSAAP